MLIERTFALLVCGAAFCGCTPSHYTPVSACPVGPDGKHPSSGRLVVLPSEVPDVQLDSMRWHVHTGHEGEEFGTWTSVTAEGRIVSTKETSLVGVGVLVEGMRNTVVVHRMIDSIFIDVRQDPLFSQSGEVITRETVRPDRPVSVGVQDKELTDTPPSQWGCPTRARIVRLSPPGTPLRAPRPPEDERPNSDFYLWNPWTFSVDTIMRMAQSRIALLRGDDGDMPRTDVVVVMSKILYRRFERGGVVADSSRIKLVDEDTLFRQIRYAEAGAPAARVNADSPAHLPNPGETILMIAVASGRFDWRFPTASPPPNLAPIVRTLTKLGDRRAPSAKGNPRPNPPR